MSNSEYQDLQNNGTAFKKFRYIIITIIKEPHKKLSIYTKKVLKKMLKGVWCYLDCLEILHCCLLQKVKM